MILYDFTWIPDFFTHFWIFSDMFDPKIWTSILDVLYLISALRSPPRVCKFQLSLLNSVSLTSPPGCTDFVNLAVSKSPIGDDLFQIGGHKYISKFGWPEKYIFLSKRTHSGGFVWGGSSGWLAGLLEKNLLLSNSLYVYSPREKHAFKSTPGSVAWPVEFLLTKFHKKHIFTGSLSNYVQTVQDNSRNWSRRFLWKTHLEGVQMPKHIR